MRSWGKCWNGLQTRLCGFPSHKSIPRNSAKQTSGRWRVRHRALHETDWRMWSWFVDHLWGYWKYLLQGGGYQWSAQFKTQISLQFKWSVAGKTFSSIWWRHLERLLIGLGLMTDCEWCIKSRSFAAPVIRDAAKRWLSSVAAGPVAWEARSSFLLSLAPSSLQRSEGCGPQTGLCVEGGIIGHSNCCWWLRIDEAPQIGSAYTHTQARSAMTDAVLKWM